eukprot:2086084-Rhodomonas_salina.2
MVTGRCKLPSDVYDDTVVRVQSLYGSQPPGSWRSGLVLAVTVACCNAEEPRAAQTDGGKQARQPRADAEGNLPPVFLDVLSRWASVRR